MLECLKCFAIFVQRKLYSLVKVSESSSYDEIQYGNHSDDDSPRQLFIHPKISATCFVSRK